MNHRNGFKQVLLTKQVFVIGRVFQTYLVILVQILHFASKIQTFNRMTLNKGIIFKWQNFNKKGVRLCLGCLVQLTVVL